uniref:Antitoxin n=1 Tax=Candidatus Kentrum sp. LFY TaxID=2126342 RepID=A0A450WMN3_9GAMM|nr:MAG: prevent-host-death family protein [Candidatus Kentron sp. LFY]
MNTYSVVEAEAKFSTLLAAVEAGEEVAISRHGRVVARIVGEPPMMASRLFEPFWNDTDIDLVAPQDSAPEHVHLVG